MAALNAEYRLRMHPTAMTKFRAGISAEQLELRIAVTLSPGKEGISFNSCLPDLIPTLNVIVAEGV